MMRFVFGNCLIPHPNKADRGGEDALFTSDEINALGVSDGVGSWYSRGVDPGIYARELMRLTEVAIQAGKLDPVQALRQAYAANKERGTATACVALLDDGQLNSVNVGDSGFIILRVSQVIQSRQITIHSFNFPFQLGQGSPDQPEDGVVVGIKLKPEDIIVMATDGLWDNLFEEQVAELVVEQSDMTKLAKNIAEEARFAATEPGRKTPWSDVGGKLDDITVVTALVVTT
ncbi:MAG TPA: SpoIIE family protein phosphatase [Candidatus Marinimicrobia bacterium]|jgi:protein phosphatase PTC7|nr:SpoIIE family protein phosphatase [Candidatus Neomarinimicrobiota bacterium]